MSRPIRIQGAGLIYHVMSRGNNRMRIFLDDLDYARFLSIVEQARQRYELDMWVVCVMPNHYHLVLRTRRPNLSLAIGHLNGTYAKWWNKRHARVGHIYQGRFKGQIVEACTYLARLCRYVLMNPVRGGLVGHPQDWRWSSYRALLDGTTTRVDVESLLAAIDPDGVVTRARLLEFVEGYADDDVAAVVRRDQRVIGSEQFAQQFASRARQASREVPVRERRIGSPSLTTVLAQALERGEGLHAGVLQAFAQSFSLQEIADCAGLSPRSVKHLVERHSAARFPRAYEEPA